MDRHAEEVLLRTISEAETQLRISRSSVYALIRDGKLQSVKLGKSVRVTDASIRQLVAQLIEQSRANAA
jgi:excisionase family DNA binding protein